MRKQQSQKIAPNPSCALNGCTENIVVKPIIVPELELRNVEMQVSFANIVECPHDSALEDAPEALNRISVHCTDNVLMPRVIDSGVRESLVEVSVSGSLIGE